MAPSIRTRHSFPHSQSLPSGKKESEVSQSCPPLYNPMDCSLPGSSIYGIFQARILEWVAISFCRRSSQPRGWTRVSHIVGRCFTIWATREVSKGVHTELPWEEPQQFAKHTELVEVLGIEPWASCMLGMCLTTELHKLLILIHQRADRMKTSITEN